MIGWGIYSSLGWKWVENLLLLFWEVDIIEICYEEKLFWLGSWWHDHMILVWHHLKMIKMIILVWTVLKDSFLQSKVSYIVLVPVIGYTLGCERLYWGPRCHFKVECYCEVLVHDDCLTRANLRNMVFICATGASFVEVVLKTIRVGFVTLKSLGNFDSWFSHYRVKDFPYSYLFCWGSIELKKIWRSISVWFFHGLFGEWGTWDVLKAKFYLLICWSLDVCIT